MADNENSETDLSVRVAVRIRPQTSREMIDMCRICTTVTPGEPQIILGLDKAFTFDYVFDVKSTQEEIYKACVQRLMEGTLCGYNATVLAYGQTGSGKTFSMGTGFDQNISMEELGIIPRAVIDVFSRVNEIQTQKNAEFSIAVQFLELYNEEIIDLLDPYNKNITLKIHEGINGQMIVSGLTIKPISSPQEAINFLQQGALARTTASTQMNDQSSRSHALFTILIRRQKIISVEDTSIPGQDIETLTSKFHFVDLAGSERLKRTGATGERAREGISINCGLLALGNCISALGDKSKRATHVPYRDSKLTRLLQDSLGGNSQTLMIACVSPCDRDFMETCNTLKYANRARNIKNKVQINQDQHSRTISQLRREVAALQLELLEYKQGKRLTDSEGNSSLSDTFIENSMLISDNKRLQLRVKAMQETIKLLSEKNAQLLYEKEKHEWTSLVKPSDDYFCNLLAGYLSEIEKLQAKLIETEAAFHHMNKTCNFNGNSFLNINKTYPEVSEDVINLAKRSLVKTKDLITPSKLPEGSVTSNYVDSLSDESDNEYNDKSNEIQADLNDIDSDIEIKTKLLEQLELSQQRMTLMRRHYEEKLALLNSRIVNTQKERDDVLANMDKSLNSNNPSAEKVKKVKEEYEKKIGELIRELRKLQQADREHCRQQRDMKLQDIKLQNLRKELEELKRMKARLIKKMSEQTNRHKLEETRKIREIAQLRKEQRRQQSTVNTLKEEMQTKDQILKRKTEEVFALRRNHRNILKQKSMGHSFNSRVSHNFDQRQARQRWENIHRAVFHASRNKQAVVQLEKELERLMSEREILSCELKNLQTREVSFNALELANEEDTLRANIDYIQNNIIQVQQAIMNFEESKYSNNKSIESIHLLIENIFNMEEAKFLLERLADSTIMYCCDAVLSQNLLLEQEAIMRDIRQENGVQQQLLQHILAQNTGSQLSSLLESLNITSLKSMPRTMTDSQKSLNSNVTYDIYLDDKLSDIQSEYLRNDVPSLTTSSEVNGNNCDKIRRRTAHPQDLLFGNENINNNNKVDV